MIRTIEILFEDELIEEEDVLERINIALELCYPSIKKIRVKN
jgi:hypothetical protein